MFNTDSSWNYASIRNLNRHTGLDCIHKLPYKNECPFCDEADRIRELPLIAAYKKYLEEKENCK